VTVTALPRRGFGPALVGAPGRVPTAADGTLGAVLADRLAAWDAAAPPFRAEGVADDTREQLRALGYLDDRSPGRRLHLDLGQQPRQEQAAVGGRRPVDPARADVHVDAHVLEAHRPVQVVGGVRRVRHAQHDHAVLAGVDELHPLADQGPAEPAVAVLGPDAE